MKPFTASQQGTPHGQLLLEAIFMDKQTLPKLNRGYYCPSPIESLRFAYQEFDRIYDQKKKYGHWYETKSELLNEIENAIVEWPLNLSEALKTEHQKVDRLLLDQDERKLQNRFLRKPRLKLTAEVTSKDNLSLRWFPTPGYKVRYDENQNLSGENASDFFDYVFEWGNQIIFNKRPMCEIIFIRNIVSVKHMFDEGSPAYQPVLAGYILDAITQLYDVINKFMEEHFLVTKIDEFEYFIDEDKNISWRLFNIKEREEKNDKEWVEGFKANYKVSINNFVERHLRDNVNQKFVPIGGVHTRREAKSVFDKLYSLPESKILIEKLQKKVAKEKRGREEKAEKQRVLKEQKRLRDDWTSIDKQELKKLIWTHPVTTIAEMFGVSDNAIGKKCKKYDIEKPPRGFWNRVHAGHIPHPDGKPV